MLNSDTKAFKCSVTMMLSCGWGEGRTRRSVGKPGGATISWRVAGSPLDSFLNSLAPKKVSAQQIADEITRLLSPFSRFCQTPVGQFCSPAKGQTWKRGNLQTWPGNLYYGERILTFESYTWGGLGGRNSLQLHLDRDAGDGHNNQMLDDLDMSTQIRRHILFHPYHIK